MSGLGGGVLSRGDGTFRSGATSEGGAISLGAEPSGGKLMVETPGGGVPVRGIGPEGVVEPDARTVAGSLGGAGPPAVPSGPNAPGIPA